MKSSVISVIFLAFAAVVSTDVAYADDDTPSYSMEDVTACSADAMRICKDKLPDIDAIEGCMKAHYAELQPKCKARFSR